MNGFWESRSISTWIVDRGPWLLVAAGIVVMVSGIMLMIFALSNL